MSVSRLIAAVIADDFTGAHEMGALLAEAGLRCEIAFQSSENTGNPEALVIDTESRHLTGSAAYRRVFEAASVLRSADPLALFRKVDSTLRGPVAEELRAMLDVFPERAIVLTPAYPSMGRTVLDGCVYVNGVPLHESHFSRDPREPAQESSILRRISTCAEDLRHISAGAGIPDLEPGSICVCDAVAEEDLNLIAAGLRIRIDKTIAAGSGGLGRHWARLFRQEADKLPFPQVRRPILISGSRHPVSRAQAQFAVEHGIPVVSAPDSPGADPEAVLTELIGKALEEIAARSPDALIVFGGDTASALLRGLKIGRLLPRREILPGVPASVATLNGADLPFITKAGGFGGTEVVERMIRRLL